MNLIINNISIISSNEKLAKTQDFYKGINVVTSNNKEKGNFLGKSSLLRSIFHTLGADAPFTSEWDKEKNNVYIIDFNVDNNNYIMVRKNQLFKLFNNKKELFNVSRRDDLSKELNKLFNQEIYLKSNSKMEYELAMPAFNYLLNFLDQNNAGPSKFNSFERLTEFTNFYDDLIYSHLGINNNQKNQLILEEQQYNADKTEAVEKNKILYEVEKQINITSNPIIDIDALNQQFKNKDFFYKELIDEINIHKANLSKAHNAKIELEHYLDELDQLINKEKKDIDQKNDLDICSYCLNQVGDKRKYYFFKVKQIDSFGIQRLDLENELNEINRKIDLESNKYNKYLNQLNEIKNDYLNENFKDNLKSLGLKEVAEKIIKDISNNVDKIEKIKSKIKTIKSEIKKINKKRGDVDKEFTNIFYEKLLKYNISGPKISIEKASDKIKVDGTHKNIISVVWLSSLLATKYLFNKDGTIYPLIFDTPNNADIDQENEDKIFKMIFDSLPEDGQIITSLIGFDESKYNDYKINKIILNNEQYKLLTKEDYEKCKIKYNFFKFI